MSPAYQPFILSCSHRDVRRVEDLLVILDIFTVVDYSKGYEKQTETSIRPVCMPYLAGALSCTDKTRLQSISSTAPTNNNEEVKQAKKKNRIG